LLILDEPTQGMDVAGGTAAEVKGLASGRTIRPCPART